ncbi:lipopolysaccharide assembly outer membrane protein LptD (OstA) [Elusimicrobium posterum]|uniref:hypothetical protein n=1 Tax=Elusimicrobium posterum TaxID=3116653 RepID=UPI003C727C69
MKTIFKNIFFITFIFCALSVTAQKLPPGLLGGMLKSDKWVIKKDLQQEEFTGNVSYNSTLYKLRSDYALSDRKKDTFTLRGNVYLYNKTLQGETLELFSDKAFYNNAKRTAQASASNKELLKIIYDLPENYKITAEGKNLALDFKKETSALDKEVKVEYETKEDFTLAFADKAFFNNLSKTGFLEGNVEIDNKEYSVFAHRIDFNQNTSDITVSGGYPLVTMDNKDATLALQSDTITVNTQTRKANAAGRVSGWISPKN